MIELAAVYRNYVSMWIIIVIRYDYNISAQLRTLHDTVFAKRLEYIRLQYIDEDSILVSS